MPASLRTAQAGSNSIILKQIDIIIKHYSIVAFPFGVARLLILCNIKSYFRNCWKLIGSIICLKIMINHLSVSFRPDSSASASDSEVSIFITKSFVFILKLFFEKRVICVMLNHTPMFYLCLYNIYFFSFICIVHGREEYDSGRCVKFYILLDNYSADLPLNCSKSY